MSADQELRKRLGQKQRMIVDPVFSSQLNHVSPLCIHLRDNMSGRPRSLVGDQKAIEIFHSAPGCGAVGQGSVIPPHVAGIIHHPSPCKQALRDKIRAIPADLLEIVIRGIPIQRPAAGIRHGGGTVINQFRQKKSPRTYLCCGVIFVITFCPEKSRSFLQRSLQTDHVD